MALARKQMSLEEFLQLPEEEPPLEFLDGGICQKVSPNYWHGSLQSELVEQINRAAGRPRIAVARPEVRITFAGISVVPDVSVFRQERIPRDHSGRRVRDLDIPPDIAIEIISPGQSANALIRRCHWYVSNGVEIGLLVDPEDSSVLAFRAGGSIDVWQGEKLIDIRSVVPNFDLAVEQLFKSLSE